MPRLCATWAKPRQGVPSHFPDLPCADAAAHMGVSVHTLRRRIRRGELEAVKDDRGRYLVKVEDTWPLPGGGGGHAAAVSLDTSADYSAEVAVLRERVARLEDELLDLDRMTAVPLTITAYAIHLSC